MHEPLTELDQPFSDPDAAPTPWSVVDQLLVDADTFWITTVRADGRPHVTPLVAVWRDGALFFCTGEHEQKAVNLRHRQQVVLTTGFSTWNQGIDIVVEGFAERVVDEVVLERLAAAWRDKWDGRWRFEVRDSGFREEGQEHRALVFEVTPDNVLSFAKSPFAATRHVFEPI